MNNVAQIFCSECGATPNTVSTTGDLQIIECKNGHKMASTFSRPPDSLFSGRVDPLVTISITGQSRQAVHEAVVLRGLFSQLQEIPLKTLIDSLNEGSTLVLGTRSAGAAEVLVREAAERGVQLLVRPLGA